MQMRDSMNMGAAMAVAAVDTILQNFRDFNRKPSDYDRIITGDLGMVGKEILLDFMREAGQDISSIHMDCGIEMFDPKTQDTHSGGSGCGCSAAVLCGYILPKIQVGEWKRVLFVPTGALLSQISFNEGQNVPGLPMEWCLREKNRSVNDRYLQETLEREQKMDYIKAFVTGGLLCAAVQILMDKTKLMPGRIMVLLVVCGSILGAIGLYEPYAKWAGSGATVPLLGFGNTLWKGVRDGIDKDGVLGLFTGGFTAGAAGISGALIFGYLSSLICKPKMKD